MSVRCCHKCTRREVGCHATCEEYIEAKKKHDEMKADIKRQRDDAYSNRPDRYYKKFSR